jgi:acetylornithine deacetylase/succinyl-diaminopimelate desuccinylase-like protein
LKSLDVFEEKKENIMADLFDLVRIPSITREREEVKKAADWLVNRLNKTADYVEMIETEGNPAVLAEWKAQIQREKTTTILFYGHYDVQPPDPLDMWDSPPFEPEIREGRIYARGIGDNKGQLFANLCGIECALEAEELGINVKFVFDGEEEIGSPFLDQALKSRIEFFKDVDLVVVSDGPADPTWKPSLEFGARGILTFRIELVSSSTDVHSGNFGGIQPNPVWDLISILKTMRDDNGKCLIKGFYDDVFTPTEKAIEAAKQLSRDPEDYMKQLGITYFGGEHDQPLEHRKMFRPTFNIRGFKSGSIRENARTIIPGEAVVEIDARLVPNQHPEMIKQLIFNHLEELKLKSERMKKVIERCKITSDTSFYPLFTPFELQWTDIIVDAIREGYGEEPLKIPLAGGSLPLQPLYEVTNKPIYIIPYANPDENNHAPNENMMIDWFENGIRTCIKLLHKLA